MFFNPQCGFCTQMLPALAALPVDDKGAPLPLVITTGKADENRRLFEEHKVRCPILLQEQMTLASKYQVNGTPMGYLIDEQGKIASIAIGRPGGCGFCRFGIRRAYSCRRQPSG